MEKMIRFNRTAVMLSGVFWTQKWLRGLFANQALETPLWVSFILLVLASIVAMVGVVTMVSNRAPAVLIMLIIITGSAVLVVSTLAEYIILIGQRGKVENTLLEIV
jgi:hypothetical protein